MNWKRGLLRLWVIASVLWLLLAAAGVAVISYKEKPQEQHLTEEQLADCIMNEETSPWCKYAKVEFVTVWEPPPWHILASLALAPLLLLGIGSAGYWVARGFRSN